MFIERTSVGLDVHARSVQAAAIDTVTGELVERTVSPVTDQILAFVDELAVGRGPVRVTYEAGPSGYGLARALLAAGQACQSRHPRSCSVRRGTGSRPTVGTRCYWPGWPATTTSSQ